MLRRCPQSDLTKSQVDARFYSDLPPKYDKVGSANPQCHLLIPFFKNAGSLIGEEYKHFSQKIQADQDKAASSNFAEFLGSFLQSEFVKAQTNSDGLFMNPEFDKHLLKEKHLPESKMIGDMMQEVFEQIHTYVGEALYKSDNPEVQLVQSMLLSDKQKRLSGTAVVESCNYMQLLTQKGGDPYTKKYLSQSDYKLHKLVGRDYKWMAYQMSLPLPYYPDLSIKEQPIAIALKFATDNGVPTPNILTDHCTWSVNERDTVEWYDAIEYACGLEENKCPVSPVL